MRQVLALVGVTLAAWTTPGNDLPKAAREAFEKAAEFELYSLDPDRGEGTEKGPDVFHGWKVLGKTTVKGDSVPLVRDAVEKGRKESDGAVAGCFLPRHGLRFTQDKKTYDLVLCFECLSAQVFEGETQIGRFLTSASPLKPLNKVLRDAKVPLPRQN